MQPLSTVSCYCAMQDLPMWHAWFALRKCGSCQTVEQHVCLTPLGYSACGWGHPSTADAETAMSRAVAASETAEDWEKDPVLLQRMSMVREAER
jgi:hypothetical protein